MIIGTISPSDYLNAQRLHRAKVVALYNICAFIAVVFGIGVLASGNMILGWGLIGAGVGCFIGEAVTNTWFLPRKINRLHAQHKDLHAEFMYSWNEEHVESKSTNGQSRRRWKDYSKFKENAEIMLLYHADNIFEMFPKAWFKSPEQLEEFRRYAQQPSI